MSVNIESRAPIPHETEPRLLPREAFIAGLRAVQRGERLLYAAEHLRPLMPDYVQENAFYEEHFGFSLTEITPQFELFRPKSGQDVARLFKDFHTQIAEKDLLDALRSSGAIEEDANEHISSSIIHTFYGIYDGLAKPIDDMPTDHDTYKALDAENKEAFMAWIKNPIDIPEESQSAA